MSLTGAYGIKWSFASSPVSLSPSFHLQLLILRFVSFYAEWNHERRRTNTRWSMAQSSTRPWHKSYQRLNCHLVYLWLICEEIWTNYKKQSSGGIALVDEQRPSVQTCFRPCVAPGRWWNSIGPIVAIGVGSDDSLHGRCKLALLEDRRSENRVLCIHDSLLTINISVPKLNSC